MDEHTALRYALEYLGKAQADGFGESCVVKLSHILPKLQAAYDLEIDKAEKAAESLAWHSAYYTAEETESLVNNYEALIEYLNGWPDAVVDDMYKKQYVDMFINR
jgi:hypothetical protein